MLKIENVETFGWEAAIRGMRNPKNSWGKSDSKPCEDAGSSQCGYMEKCDGCCYDIGENDLKLMHTLASVGTDHRKFMRMIVVSADITAPLYWWKEFDTYKVGTTANSCSTMHKIAAKEFTLDDFSHEHLIDPHGLLADIVTDLNSWREDYLRTQNKDYWWQLIQLLPSSYNQRRTVMLNYEVLANMYKSRRNHKLDEWHTLCNWIDTLPHSELITGKKN